MNAPEPPSPLPARRRRTRPGGRHRGAESFAVPEDAPALVLAVPGPPAPAGSPEEESVARTIAELAAVTEGDHPGLQVRAAYAPDLPARLAEFVTSGPAGPPSGVIVVPLATGPLPQLESDVRHAVAAVRADPSVVVAATEPLGPHPLIAQALHTRLTEAGLARQDRVRLLTMVTSADGVIVAVTGGEGALRDAEVTCVLLASRLAVPVVPIALDLTDRPGDGVAAVQQAADRLRGQGAVQIAVAPCVIGPEGAMELRALATAEPKIGIAAAIGAHPAISQLIAERYATALERAWAEFEG